MRFHAIKMGFVQSYLICGERGCVLVDAGYKEDAKKMLAGIGQSGRKPEDIQLIVITHAHRDHVGGLTEIKKKSGASVLIHEKEASFLSEGKSAPVFPANRILRVFVKPGTRQIFSSLNADITMSDDFDLTPYGVEGKVIHTPGHTPGSVAVIVGKEAFVGDTAMKFGFLSGKSYKPIIAGDLDEVARSWKKILDEGVETIHPSHGKSFPAMRMKKMLETFTP